jgi:hypothetical protein
VIRQHFDLSKEKRKQRSGGRFGPAGMRRTDPFSAGGIFVHECRKASQLTRVDLLARRLKWSLGFVAMHNVEKGHGLSRTAWQDQSKVAEIEHRLANALQGELRLMGIQPG